MADWFDTLAHSLTAAGWPTAVWGAGRARLLVVPRAARIIACQIPGARAGAGADHAASADGSLFWHDPRLTDPAQTDAIMNNGGIAGGDRLWIAPESAFMWKNLARDRHDLAGTARTPAEMDPGKYHVLAQSPGHTRVSAEMTLHDGRTNKKITVHVTRQFDLLKPLADLPDRVAGMSFAIRNDLTVLSGDTGAAVGCWDLLQLPPVGTLTCPTVRPVAKPRSYYESFGNAHIRTSEVASGDTSGGGGAVSFLIDARRRIKMGLAPDQTTGRMGYYRRLAAASTLIVRLFTPQPGRLYVDLPVDEVLKGRHAGGDALQAFNDSGNGTGFGEMEYHEPALVVGEAPATSSGAGVTHCLAGPDGQIREAGKRLLGVELADLAGGP